MAKKSTTKRNAPDATERNVKASNRRDLALTLRVRKLEQAVVGLRARLGRAGL